MRVTGAYVKDFRIVKHKEIEFSPDKPVVLVKGRNGSGKSSILKAINFLLFNVKQDETSFKDFIRKGCKESSIAASFNHAGEEFSLSATIGKTVARKMVFADEMFENSQVIEKLGRVLPGYSLGIQASTSFQGMTDLISATPSERRTMLEKVYQLDLSEQITSLQAEVKSMQEEIREIDKQVFHLENSKKQLQRFTVDCDWNQEEQDKKIQEQESLTKKLGDLEKIESLVMLIEKNRKRIAQLSEEIGLSTIDRQNFEIERKTGLYALRREGELFQDRVLELNDTIKDLQRDKDTLLKDKSWFAKGVCPTCNAPIQDAEKKVIEIQEKISGIDNFIEKYSRENLSLQQKLSEIKAKVFDITKSQSALKREIAKEREERNQLDAWKKELGIAMQQTTELAKSCPEPDVAITEVQDKLEILKKEIQRFRDQETRRFAIEKQNDEARKFNEDSKIKLAEFSDKKESLLEAISVATQSQMILTRDFPSWILMKESKSVEAEMNRFLDEVYEGRYHVSIDVAKAGIGIFYNDGSDVSLASGSEKDLMNLAFKMALSRLSGMKILFLDEVDKFCDVKVAGKLFDVVIEQVNKGKLDQVFIVTHSVDMQNKLELREEVQVVEV